MFSDSLPKQGMSFLESKETPKSQPVVRRKPGRPPKQHPPGTINGLIAECAVCHDKATGLHYAVMTCEGCKGFFKRSIQADKIYKCRNKCDCVINKETRNACQACRMKRCFAMGMKEKLVRDDRTPGNRKKKYTESLLMTSHQSSDNSDNANDYVKTEPTCAIKHEGSCIDQIRNLSIDTYPLSCKKRYESYSNDYCSELSSFNFGNISLSTNPISREGMCNSMLEAKDYDDWGYSRMSAEVMVDVNSSHSSLHISPPRNPHFNHSDHLLPLAINCSGDQELPLKKCKLSPKCLMHLLTRLMKAKPIEPAFCKYFDRFPTSEQFLDCLADEIHLIIKFAKKTPGFCDLTMGRKLGVVQKHALSILFIRIIYRSLSCPANHVQFGSNICLNYSDFAKIDILSNRFCQSIIELISSYRSLNMDIYELCLIQYAIIEEEDNESEMRCCPIVDGFERPTHNLSQKYLQLYTRNKYPDQPHRWIFIMLSLTQVQATVRMFTSRCMDMVNAQQMAISNDILKEILSI